MSAGEPRVLMLSCGRTGCGVGDWYVGRLAREVAAAGGAVMDTLWADCACGGDRSRDTVPGDRLDPSALEDLASLVPGNRLTRVPWGTAVRGRRLGLEVRRRVDAGDGPDLVHYQQVYDKFSAVALRGLLHRSPVPVVVTVHEHAPHPDPDVLPRAAHVVALTDSVRSQLLETMPALDRERVSVLPLGTDVPESVPPPAERDGVCVFGFLGKGKGMDVLCDALAILGDDAPTVRLVGHHGEPWRSEVRDHAAAAGVADRLDWRGPAEDLDDAIAHAALALLPYTRSRQSSIALRCAALGTPVIASRVGSMEETFGRDGATWVEPGDAEALAAALRAWQEDPRPFVQATPAARRHVERLHDWRRVAAGHVRLWRSLLESPGAGS